MDTSNSSWFQRMQADLIVAGLSERTQEAYLRAVRQLSEYHSGTLPGDLSEQQVKDYLLWLRIEKRAAPGTLKTAIGGLRFFYRQTHPVTWKVLDRFRIPPRKETAGSAHGAGRFLCRNRHAVTQTARCVRRAAVC